MHAEEARGPLLDVSGTLWKKGRKRKTWKKRFFVLHTRQRKLQYFAKEGDEAQKGVFHLCGSGLSVPAPAPLLASGSGGRARAREFYFIL